MPEGKFGGPRPLLEDTHLMVGFPVELPEPSPHADPDRDIISELKNEVASKFAMSTRDIKLVDVRLMGFDAPIVKFVYFPVEEENEPKTTNYFDSVRDRAEQVVQNVLGDDLNADVSVWAGTKDSGSKIASK